MGQTKKPYGTLGQKLKTVRVSANRSLAEVSGAVEIEVNQLRLIEAGLKRPEEDVMLLLISYFNLADKEAIRLWELAEYGSELSEHLLIDDKAVPEEKLLLQLLQKPMVMLLATDARVIYSDGFEANWSQSGLTLNFTQKVRQAGHEHEMSIAKVGMSLTQAETVLADLQLAILHSRYAAKPKLLPPGHN